MELFRKLMSFFRHSEIKLDPVANLPVEVVSIIFRSLDPKSLLNAVQVSQGWLDACRGDSFLRTTARRHLRRDKRQTYNIPSVVKSRVGRTTIVRKQLVMGVPQNAFTSAPAAVFHFGPSGISSGHLKNNIHRRNSEPRLSSGSKGRLTIRLR